MLENFEFPNYPRINFRFVDFTSSGISPGIADLLMSSPKMLYHPNDISNLHCRPIQEQVYEIEFNREIVREVMTTLLTLETVVELADSFLNSVPMTRRVEWTRSQLKPENQDQLQQFEIFFQTGTTAYNSYQKKYNCGLWLMHMPVDASSSHIQFKLKDSIVAENCVLVAMKTFFFVKDYIPQGNRPPIWPDVRGRNIDQQATMIKIRASCYVVVTPANRTIVENLRSQEEVAITFVGQLSQFVKALRIISIPERPRDVAPALDYNVCPVYDGIFKPQTFNVAIYNQMDTFKEKFNKLMNSDKLSILLVDGAPGTGKTSNVVTVVSDYIIAAKQNSRPLPHILVTAPSNAAADVLYTKLRSRLSDVIICRIGDIGKFSPEVRQQAIDARQRYRTDMQNRRAEIERTTGEEFTDDTICKNYIKDAVIVVSTLGSSQNGELVNLRHRLKFDLLIVDECGQAKMDEILFPLYFTSIHRALLIGDPRQLGPTIKSSIVMKFPLEQISIFVKIFTFLQQNAPNAIVSLREQHRMRPFVASMVSCISYADDDCIKTNRNGNWKKTENHPALLVFSGESWMEKRVPGSFSFENQKEAEFGIALLKASLERQGFNFYTNRFPEGKELNYVIIPLYLGQVNLYRRLLVRENLDKIVKVLTVDQMQGSECDIAIVSAVRASAEHLGVGFASDLRRLNVALSRGACVYVLAKHIDFYTRQGWSKLYNEAARNDCAYTKADQILKDKTLRDVLDRRSRDDVYLEVVPVRPH